MKCPVCEENSVMILHSDFLECHDCGKPIRIDYCVCKLCGNGFRLNNDQFIENLGTAHLEFDDDGQVISVEMNEPVSDEDILLNMTDLILPCARCQSPAVYQCGDALYECGDCGFQWEILKNV